MAVMETRSIAITGKEGGSIDLERQGTSVTITQTIYQERDGRAMPIELDASDRRALMAFLNMGEYRELTYEEAR